MNCLPLILLLACAGNGNGNNGCGGGRPGNYHRGVRGNRDFERDGRRSCDDRNDRNVRGNRNDECCDDRSTRPSWQEFPGINRGETCGCEEEQQL